MSKRIPRRFFGAVDVGADYALKVGPVDVFNVKLWTVFTRTM